MEGALLVMQAQVSRPSLPPQEVVVPPGVANQGFAWRDPANEQCKYCTAMGHYVRACPKLNHDILKRRCTRSLNGEIFGPQGKRVNWNSPGGMRRVVIMLNGLEITTVEAEPVVNIVWDQQRACGPQVNFILESDGRDRVNVTTRLGTAGRRINRDDIMEEVAGSSELQAEPEAEEPEKVYGKPREEELADKVTAAKKKFRYQIPILNSSEIDDTISKLLGTMVSVSFQTMLQASPRLLKGLRQLLTRRRVEIGDNPELPEGEKEEEAPQEVANLQRSRGDLEDLEKAFADIRLSLPDREGGEVMRSPLGTKLSFHALPVGKLKVQIGSHHTDALVDGGTEITLIRIDFATITGCTVNKEVTGSIQGAGGKIQFTGYVTKCAVKAGVRESIWSFQRMTVMEEMDHDIILRRPWCTNVEMIGMHFHDDSYMIDIEDPVTDQGELFRLLGTGGDPPKGKLATWSPSFEDSTRKGAFARMEDLYSGYDQLPLDVRDRLYTAMHTPVGQLHMQVTPMGFTNSVAEAQRRMLAVAGDMFPKKCEPYIDDNPIKGAQEKDEMEVQPGIRSFVWDHLQDIKDLLRRFLVYNITAIGPKSILAVPEVTILGFRCGAYGRKPDPAKTDKISQWPTPLRTTTEFDYKIEQIAGIRNKADGLSRVCITPEGVEDAEPIDAFLEYEGGTLAVDNEMMSEECTSGELLIQTLEKAAPAVVAELREGPVTTRGHKEEKDSWGAIVVPKEELIAMAVEGGREAVMSLVESWERKELQWMVGTSGPPRPCGPVSTDGYMYILDARDNLSGFVEAVALKKKTGRSVADWIKDFYLRHPFVRRFIADNGTKFVNQEVLGMLKRLCVPIKLVEPYHPEANAPVERGHRTLKNMIAKLAADHLGNWPRYLKQAVFAENMTPKRTTGCIPAELWYGREIDFPVEALVRTWNRLDDNPRMTTEELIEARCQQILKNEEVMEDIANRVLDTRMRDKTRWDQVKNVRKEPLQVGEMVLLRNSALESTWSGQLGKRFKGAYRVAKRVRLNTFELEDLDETGLKWPFPDQRLVRFLSRDPVEQWLQEAEHKETEEPQAKD
ncbi:hypothetical protein CBR_g60032 [Chara braunii]|uniref:Integrase catalytic domain-containing protein n=1 Tax=Chara braunii TaxID=69332 RepID=A0A388K8L1_CHABU|nr:hypothetical protein CBR_g60032 [Chara braunii]|eukprot:GBG66380.1 hypothetical protein CBR_g60032 [Chara braunii]